MINALVEISCSLYEAQHTDRRLAPSNTDVRILGEVLGAVATASEVLVERFVLPAVHMATSTGPQRNGLSPATRLLWKPVGRLWTAPVVEPASAWALWAAKTGNARVWDRQFRYESPPRAARVVVDSLTSADNLVGNRSFEQTVHTLTLGGVSRIDFTWRCVLEAECSALLGERSPKQLPLRAWDREFYLADFARTRVRTRARRHWILRRPQREVGLVCLSLTSGDALPC